MILINNLGLNIIISMEKNINKKLDGFQVKLKEDILTKIKDLGITEKCPNESLILNEFISNYTKLIINKQDLVKRKRNKNEIVDNERCNAKRANGEQCSRRKKEGELFCGTHLKGVPHGEIIEKKENVIHEVKKEVFSQEIKGITYFLDYENNVYNTGDIVAGIKNPGIIAKYTKSTTGEIHIPELNI